MKLKNFLKMLTLTLCSLLVSGCSSEPPTPDINTSAVIHKATGIVFPFNQNSFTRIGTEQKESLFSADYFHMRSDEIIKLRINVFPVKGNTLAEELDEFKQFFNDTETDKEARFVTTFDVPTVQGDKIYKGKKSLFRVSDGAFMNVHIFEYGEYIVRFYYRYARDLERVGELFVNELKWNGEKDSTSDK
jgi:hypothetical protein